MADVEETLFAIEELIELLVAEVAVSDSFELGLFEFVFIVASIKFDGFALKAIAFVPNIPIHFFLAIVAP